MNIQDPKELLAHFEARNPAICDTIRRLVELESPSHDAARSAAVADLIGNELLATGVPLEIERVAVDDGVHLIANAFPGSGPRTFILGHTDTVHPVGASRDNPTRIEGDRLYGCGTFDMKANIPLLFEAFRYLADAGVSPRGPVTVLLSCDEEVGSMTGRALVEREAVKADRCLILEPSADGKVKTARKGTGIYKVTAHGVPSHAGLEPDRGANAVVELSKQVERIQTFGDRAIGTTVNVTTFHGGTTSNVIPDLASCEVDVRFSSAAEADRIEGAFRSLLPFDDRVSLEIGGGINRPPLERTRAVAELYANARDLAATFGYDLGETQVGGASDGNFVGALGVPVLDGLGMAGDGAHTLDEYILVSDIAKRATLLTLLLCENSGSPPPGDN